MKVYSASGIRNVALVGHTGAGKTQLASALLADTNMVGRFGTVDAGTTVTDFDDEEIARKHTLSASLAYAEFKGLKINLIDTPGMGNFFSEARAALRVVDAAVVVVDAVAGSMVQTEKAWAVAAEAGLPRVVVINRLDRERASLPRALASLHEACSRGIVPLQLPLGAEGGFRGVVDLIARKAWGFSADRTGRFQAEAVPDDLIAAVEQARQVLVERVAETDEALMQAFFDDGTLSDVQLVDGLRRATIAAQLFPAVCAAALENIGIPQVLDAVVSYLPSPCDRAFVGLGASGAVIRRPADETAPALAYVWKTIADPFAGRLTLFRVLSGALKADSVVHNHTRDVPERLGHVEVLQGKTHTAVPQIKAGDVGAVAKLKDTLTGDTLGDRADLVVFAPMAFPEPVLAYAIEPRTHGDEDKISTAMHRLQEEDPAVHYSRDPQTQELLLSGQGQLHIEVTIAKLKRRFGVDVLLKPPRIPYRETIKAATEGHGRHKKQTGGHGQFGDCRIRVEPLPRGSDFQFVDDIFGGAIPRQFVPAIEKGIREARSHGCLAGFPLVDFRVTVIDGAYHDVDSNELSFKLAGSLALKDALTRARPTILEPVMQVEVCTPSDFAGDLMGDLNGRRGRIAGMDTRGATTVIKAQVPMAEMLTYEQHLTSATGGRGTYHMEYSHHDEVPAPLQARIVAAARRDRPGAPIEET